MVSGTLPVALDLVDELVGHAEVLQAARARRPRRRDRVGADGVARRLGPAECLLDEQPGGLIEQLLAEHRHQRVALLDVGAAGDRHRPCR